MEIYISVRSRGKKTGNRSSGSLCMGFGKSSGLLFHIQQAAAFGFGIGLVLDVDFHIAMNLDQLANQLGAKFNGRIGG